MTSLRTFKETIEFERQNKFMVFQLKQISAMYYYPEFNRLVILLAGVQSVSIIDEIEPFQWECVQSDWQAALRR